MNPEIEPWENRLRFRILSAIEAASAVRAGKRKDVADVLRGLWQASDNLDFHSGVNPDRCGFIVETCRDLLTGRIEALEAMLDASANPSHEA